jgi:hypothetical protein
VRGRHRKAPTHGRPKLLLGAGIALLSSPWPSASPWLQPTPPWPRSTPAPPPAELAGADAVPEETARLLAGGLASHLSGRVLAGEAEGLHESHELLLHYLLAPSFAATSHSAEERRARRQ